MSFAGHGPHNDRVSASHDKTISHIVPLPLSAEHSVVPASDAGASFRLETSILMKAMCPFRLAAFERSMIRSAFAGSFEIARSNEWTLS